VRHQQLRLRQLRRLRQRLHLRQRRGQRRRRDQRLHRAFVRLRRRARRRHWRAEDCPPYQRGNCIWLGASLGARCLIGMLSVYKVGRPDILGGMSAMTSEDGRLSKNAYERFVRPLLFSLDAETAHHFTIRLLRSASHFDLALRALKYFQPPSKPKTVFGLNFPNPIVLAAGLDKNGVALPAWTALRF